MWLFKIIWKPIKKFLRKRKMPERIAYAIAENHKKFDEEDILKNKSRMAVHERCGTRLRNLKMKTMPKPKKFGIQ